MSPRRSRWAPCRSTRPIESCGGTAQPWTSSGEFDLLLYLARRPGQTITRDALYKDVRGIEYDGLDRSIDLRIARLRKKLGDDAKQPALIKSVRGEGYLLAPGGALEE